MFLYLLYIELFMIQLNGEDYLTPSEAMAFIGIPKSTFYDQIKLKGIPSINSSHGILVRKSDAVTHRLKYLKNRKNVNISVNEKINDDDKWLQNDINKDKIIEWGNAYRTKWANMNLIDYTKYWLYIIKPKWIESEIYTHSAEFNPTKTPTKSWLISNGFKSFISSFEKKYLLKDGIPTMSKFWEYLVSNELW